MKFRIAVTAVLVLLLASSLACDPAAKVENVHKGAQGQVIDYGNGLYYFPYTNDYFGNALATFVGQHQELELVSMAGNGTGLYGLTVGYFVYFRTK